MKAVGYTQSLPVDNADCLVDVTLPEPSPGPRDLLVEVRAVSVNPVDTKVRMRAAPEPGDTKVLGFDAAGTVKAVGSDVTLFKPGDDVFYAGSLDRPGTNSELHVVDERIVGRKPNHLSFADAAALPLTAITAWELLFDRFSIPQTEGQGQSILIIGGAGGVGSIMIQLARQLTDLTVIATASRNETRDWCLKMGANHVIDHREDMAEQLGALELQPSYVAGLTATDQHFETIAQVLAPQGKFGLIDDPDFSAINIGLLKQKSASIHWEFMFARPVFQTDDMIEQHRLLTRVAEMVEAGQIISTATTNLGTISATNLRKAHELQESGKAIGKTVLEGF